jgi:O-antigen ligase
MIPFCTAMVLGERGRWRLIGAASVALCAIALFASQTRAGALGVLAGLLLVILLHQGSRAFRGLRMGTTIAAVAFLVGAGTAGFALSGDSGATTHKYSALFDPNSDQSVVQRRIKWDQALNDLRGYPFGYGIGTSTSGFARGVVSTRFYLNVGARSIDNGYLKVALEQGLVAMGFYIAAFVLFIGGLSWFAVTTSDRRQATIALGGAGALLSLAVLLIAGAFTEGPTALAVWVVAGMGGAMVTRRGAAEEAPVAKDPSVLPAAQT